jgi:hypothetical protein
MEKWKPLADNTVILAIATSQRGLGGDFWKSEFSSHVEETLEWAVQSPIVLYFPCGVMSLDVKRGFLVNTVLVELHEQWREWIKRAMVLRQPYDPTSLSIKSQLETLQPCDPNDTILGPKIHNNKRTVREGSAIDLKV